MRSFELIEIGRLRAVARRPTLRVVLDHERFRVEHVTVKGVSNPHMQFHPAARQAYFVLKGQGVFYGIESATRVKPYSIVPVEAGELHSLASEGVDDLEYLVIRSPNDASGSVTSPMRKVESAPKAYEWVPNLVPNAIDGSVLFELFLPDLKEKYGLGVGLEVIKHSRATRTHYHSRSDALYSVVRGVGEIELNGSSYSLQEGMAAFVPAGMLRKMRNTDSKSVLELLAVSSPPFDKAGFVVPSDAQNDGVDAQK